MTTKDDFDVSLHSQYTSSNIMAWLLARGWGVQVLTFLTGFSSGANTEGLHCEERFISSSSGNRKVRIRIYKPLNHTGKLPGVAFYHPGGYLVGNPERSAGTIKALIDASPCVVVSPDYIKSPYAPYPAAFDDCYDTLLWLKENAEPLGVIDDKYIVAGQSAGGGLTAAVALKAAETGDVNIAFQMPLYPMLDDKQDQPSAVDNTAPCWNSSCNKHAWEVYLRGIKGGEIPPYAAPTRTADFTILPPTITYVGDLEAFRDEVNLYVYNLKKAGIPVIFKEFKKVFHAFDIVAPEADISKEAVKFMTTSFQQYVAEYITSKE